MKATPIAKYLGQMMRTEPVAWPQARRDSTPFKPRPAGAAQSAQAAAAAVFRRATQLAANESSPYESLDLQADAEAEADIRSRETIFSRARQAPPEPDLETRLSEAYHRGVQEGLDAAQAEAATARALERAETQKRAVVDRLDFQMNEYARVAEAISSGLIEVENRIADVVARILQPLVSQAVSREIVDELVENIGRLRGAGQPGLMKIRGPERLLQVLKQRVAKQAVEIEYVPEDSVEVTVEAEHTIIRSELAAWADLVASASEGLEK